MFKLTLLAILMTVYPITCIAKESHIKLIVPPHTKYQVASDLADARCGDRDLVITDAHVNDKTTIDFFWVGYTHEAHAFDQDPRWNLTCHVGASQHFDDLVQFGLVDEQREGFVGPKDTPAHIWCPLDQATCESGNCEGKDVIPFVDSGV